MTELTTPSPKTTKMLFARSGNCCAFPKCVTPLTEGPHLVGEICHIAASREKGPRFDPNQNDKQRHGYDNLILLCPTHHKIVDDDIDTYTVGVLKKMKSDREKDANQMSDVDAARGATLIMQSVNQTNIAAQTIETVNVYHGPNIQSAKPEAASVTAGMAFFARGEGIANERFPNHPQCTFDLDRYLFLRVTPKLCGGLVSKSIVWDVFRKRMVRSMTELHSGNIDRNKYGTIFFQCEGISSHIAGLTQGFSTGELWGLNNKVFVFKHEAPNKSWPAKEFYLLEASAMEKLYRQTLSNYVAVIADAFSCTPPFTVELGLKCGSDLFVSLPNSPSMRRLIHEEGFRRTYALNDKGPSAVSKLARTYFSELYDDLLSVRREDEFAE